MLFERDSQGRTSASISKPAASSLLSSWWCSYLQRELRRGRWAFRELKAAQARLQDMTESSFDWAWETDADLRYAYISGQVAGAATSEQDSYIGKTRFEIADLTHDPDGWKRHAEDMAARRPFRDFVFRQPMTDGSARWRKVSGKPFYDAAGRFCGYRGTAIDITAQKEAEQALSAIRAQQKERDRSHRTLIANISGAVYRMRMDEEWTDIFISDAVEKIWGYSAAECLAKAAPLFSSAIHPDDREAWSPRGRRRRSRSVSPMPSSTASATATARSAGSPTAASRSSTKAGSCSISTASSSTSPTACGPRPS